MPNDAPEPLHAGKTLRQWDAEGVAAHNAGQLDAVPRKLQATKSFPAMKAWAAGWKRAEAYKKAQEKLPKPVGMPETVA